MKRTANERALEQCSGRLKSLNAKRWREDHSTDLMRQTNQLTNGSADGLESRSGRSWRLERRDRHRIGAVIGLFEIGNTQQMSAAVLRLLLLLLLSLSMRTQLWIAYFDHFHRACDLSERALLPVTKQTNKRQRSNTGTRASSARGGAVRCVSRF